MAIDLFIIWFACASVVAFVTTKDHREAKNCEPEICEQEEEQSDETPT